MAWFPISCYCYWVPSGEELCVASDQLSSHSPAAYIDKFCLLSVYSHISWNCISLACLEHSLLPTTTISCILSSIQVPAAPGRCHLFPSLSHPLVWVGMFYRRLPEPWRALFLIYSVAISVITDRVGQMLMNSDSSFFCRLVSFTCDWNVKQKLS